MADILRTSVLNNSDTVVSFEQVPFWPVTFLSSEGEWKVRFNPGFVIDYQNQYGTKIQTNMQEAYRPSNMDSSFLLSEGSQFYLAIETYVDGSDPIAITIRQGSATSLDAWHFGSVNVKPEGYFAISPEFRIPMCSLNAETGEIQEVCLRENIHYQQVALENIGEGARVLQGIGETKTVYGAHPFTKLRSIRGIHPIVVEEGDDEIFISLAESSGADGGGGGTPTNPTNPTIPTWIGGKSAIVPFQDKYIAFWCAEAPEPYFFDIITVELDGKVAIHKIDDEIIASCEEGSLKIAACHPEGSIARVSAKIDEDILTVRNHSWFKKADKVNVFLIGTVKGSSGHRYKEYKESQYNSNKLFYSLAHNENFSPLSMATKK